MIHGYSEVRTVKMEPGPDGKPIPHVYVERRELTEEEARKLMDEQKSVFEGFDGIFSGLDGMFKRIDEVFKKTFGPRAR